MAEGAGIRELARAALRKARTLVTDEALDDITDALSTIRTSGRIMRDKAIAIGKALNILIERAGPGGYRALARKGLVRIPEANVSKYRSIASLVASGIEQDLLPLSVNASYALARQGPEIVNRLISDGTVRPEVTEPEIARAVIRISPPLHEEQQVLSAAERRKYEKQLKKLQDKVAYLRGLLGTSG